MCRSLFSGQVTKPWGASFAGKSPQGLHHSRGAIQWHLGGEAGGVSRARGLRLAEKAQGESAFSLPLLFLARGNTPCSRRRAWLEGQGCSTALHPHGEALHQGQGASTGLRAAQRCVGWPGGLRLGPNPASPQGSDCTSVIVLCWGMTLG